MKMEDIKIESKVEIDKVGKWFVPLNTAHKYTIIFPDILDEDIMLAEQGMDEYNKLLEKEDKE